MNLWHCCKTMGVVSPMFCQLSKIMNIQCTNKYTMTEITFMVRNWSWNFVSVWNSHQKYDSCSMSLGNISDHHPPPHNLLNHHKQANGYILMWIWVTLVNPTEITPKISMYCCMEFVFLFSLVCEKNYDYKWYSLACIIKGHSKMAHCGKILQITQQ